MNNDKLVKRIIIMLLGNLIIGLGIALMSILNMGVEPYTTLTLGISTFLNMSLGTFQMGLNAVIMVIAYRICKDKLGIGTIINLVAIGYIIEYANPILSSLIIGDGELSFAMKLIWVMIGLVVFAFGASLTFVAGLGIGPYDSVGFVICHYTKMDYKVTRVISDIACVAIGFGFGSVVGIGTILPALLVGPLIGIFRTKIESLV
ncbi:MAG: hypothetical protein ATN35_11245 [Epulopiscium sp. Nele67-Bin004]|nr:MAG: hypothetical protein ATN35_11245 [Epulopiscium sp. Nele67-Bin004]